VWRCLADVVGKPLEEEVLVCSGARGVGMCGFVHTLTVGGCRCGDGVYTCVGMSVCRWGYQWAHPWVIEVFVCGVSGVSSERVWAGSLGAVRLTLCVCWLVWCCVPQQERPVQRGEERAWRRRSKGECRPVGLGMWEGVLQSVGVWNDGVREATRGIAGRV
jgi:hypothetical protein